METLYFLHKFSANLKLLLKIMFIKKKKGWGEMFVEQLINDLNLLFFPFFFKN